MAGSGRRQVDFGEQILEVTSDRHAYLIAQAVTQLIKDNSQLVAEQKPGWQAAVKTNHGAAVALDLLLKTPGRRYYVANLQLRMMSELRRPMNRDEQQACLVKAAAAVKAASEALAPRKRTAKKAS